MPGVSEIYLNNIKTVSDVPSSNVSGDGYSYLSSLKNGDTFSAKVVSTNGSDVTLRLPGGSTINAKLSDGMNITEGQTVSFELKSSGSSISISPLLTNTATDPSVIKALDQAQIPITDSSVAMTAEMMKAGLSIDKNSLLKMYENVRAFPNSEVSDIVDLTKLGLKVDGENLQNIENYKNLSYQIDQGMKDIAAKTDEALMSLVKNGDTSNAVKLMDTILDTALTVTDALTEETEENAGASGKPAEFTGSENGSAEVKDTVKADAGATAGSVIKEENSAAGNSLEIKLSEEGTASQNLNGSVEVKDPAAKALELLKMMQDNAESDSGKSVSSKSQEMTADKPSDALQPSVNAAANDTSQMTTADAFKEAVEVFKEISGNQDYSPATVQEFLKDISSFTKNAISSGNADSLKGLVSDEGFRKLLFDTLKDKWSISPTEVADKEKVENLYKRLSQQIKMISDGLANAGVQNSPAFSATQNMSSNIDFLQQINQMYAYIQLPLKLSGGDSAHGDLYVYSNKKSFSGDESSVTAFLHLDMDNLGPVDVFVSMDVKSGGKVSTRFTVADDETLDFLSDHMDLLNERLRKRGYELNCSMGVKGADPDPEEEALDKGGVNLLLLHAGTGPGLSSRPMRSFDVRA